MNTEQKRPRLSFAKNVNRAVTVPTLHSTQVQSFDDFLQLHVEASQRVDSGLQHAFTSVFPVCSSSGIHRVEFVSYELKNPEFSLAECRVRGLTYSAPVWANLRFVSSNDRASAAVFGSKVGSHSVSQVREESVFVADLPLMTPTGSFLINGTERVVISQVHRSPGAFFIRETEKTSSGEQHRYTARIAPARGSWIEFEFDSRNRIWFRLDKRKRMPATLLLRAFGLSNEDMLATFFDHDVYRLRAESVQLISGPKGGDVFPVDLVSRSGDVLIRAGRTVSDNAAKTKMSELDAVHLPYDYVVGRTLAADVVAQDGTSLARANEELTDSLIAKMYKTGVTDFRTLRINDKDTGAWLAETLTVDKTETKQQARTEIFSMILPKDTRDEESVDLFFDELFGNESYYEFSEVGRYKFNARIYKPHSSSVYQPEWVRKLIPARPPKGYKNKQTLTKLDVLCVLGLFIEMRNGRNSHDDVDSLDTRRVRPVGELLQAQVRSGLLRAASSIKEKLNKPGGAQGATPGSLMNTRSVSQMVREFFASSQLSQFMDQTNPLSELTHKRRVSALGPGGLTKDSNSFEVRDVHPSHYGRLCPIETPEGPNIGLINSLALYARTNKHGFLETPFQKVIDGRITDDVVYLSAVDEKGIYIAQASSIRDAQGNLLEDRVQCRHEGEFTVTDRARVNYIDVAFEQVVSIAASTIPFLEHDDANRSLMGSNMLRQAVPCMFPEKPLIGTGMERIITRDSGNTILARRSGVVEYVDAKRIVIRTGNATDTYSLIKRSRSNQSTDLNQRPMVRPGERIAQGDVLADGSASDLGELALGQNMVIAFMPWNGYNFEDSILLSERVVSQDRFTSVHIEELTLQVRETNLGPEELTRDIPTLSENQLAHLDSSGIAFIGSKVKPGDVIVGKVTPKSDAALGAEDKLLRAIFGDKSSDVSESCLRVPAGTAGTVIDVQVFTRSDTERDVRASQIVEARVREMRTQMKSASLILEDRIIAQAIKLLEGAKYINKKTGRLVLLHKINLESLVRTQGRDRLFSLPVDRAYVKLLEPLKNQLKTLRANTSRAMKAKEKILTRGDDLPHGVIRLVKVYVAVKRQLQAGDKMAGRHGNKGVVSRVVAVEDMPRLKDGTVVDVVLNPLGVPSRMNIGQVLEVHLGWAALGLGQRIAEILDATLTSQACVRKLRDLLGEICTVVQAANPYDQLSDHELLETAENYRKGFTLASPVFDGATEDQIRELLLLAYPDTVAESKGLTDSRLQAMVYDGQTGDQFERPVTVGVMNMLKLHHLVEDKMHARSTGPYSLVTQQPLGGKSQMGGQRVGEMEVWALEAYGAAHVLQEMLTVKSDDVRGREAAYQNILADDHKHEVGMPESFNVLAMELRALGLDITLERNPVPNQVARSSVNKNGKKKARQVSKCPD